MMDGVAREAAVERMALGSAGSQGLRKERAWQWRMIVEDDNDKEHE